MENAKKLAAFTKLPELAALKQRAVLNAHWLSFSLRIFHEAARIGICLSLFAR